MITQWLNLTYTCWRMFAFTVHCITTTWPNWAVEVGALPNSNISIDMSYCFPAQGVNLLTHVIWLFLPIWGRERWREREKERRRDWGKEGQHKQQYCIGPSGKRMENYYWSGVNIRRPGAWWLCFFSFQEYYWPNDLWMTRPWLSQSLTLLGLHISPWRAHMVPHHMWEITRLFQTVNTSYWYRSSYLIACLKCLNDHYCHLTFTRTKIKVPIC